MSDFHVAWCLVPGAWCLLLAPGTVRYETMRISSSNTERVHVVNQWGPHYSSSRRSIPIKLQCLHLEVSWNSYDCQLSLELQNLAGEQLTD